MNSLKSFLSLSIKAKKKPLLKFKKLKNNQPKRFQDGKEKVI